MSTITLPASRAEREQVARELREQGLFQREIAERMGVAISTVGDWLSDPGGAKLAARKHSYRGVCEVCDGPTDGSDGADAAPTLCQSCRAWPADACVQAIRDWAASHGGLPPTNQEWRHADIDHPGRTTVCNRIGWNEALLQAGFGLRCDRRPETQKWIVEQLRAGRPATEIADALGVSAQNITVRLRTRGTTITEVRRARVVKPEWLR